MQRDLDPTNLSDAEDWEGSNVAFACPVCAKVFIVTGLFTVGGEAAQIAGSQPVSSPGVGRVVELRRFRGRSNVS